MNHNISGLNGNLGKTMNTEQFEQVVEAIIAGKYSWACVLLLRFAGYNPLHYIPYRTYNRLLKENTQMLSLKADSDDLSMSDQSAKHRSSIQSQNCLGKIKDLPYLETAGKQKSEIRGGNFEYSLKDKLREHAAMELELISENDSELFLIFSKSP